MMTHVFGFTRSFPPPAQNEKKIPLRSLAFGFMLAAMMKIDDHVPPPPRKSRRYPFRDMEPGQSVFFPGENKSDRQHPAYMAAKTLQKRHGLRFTLRSVIEDGVKGVRIWRVT